MSFTQAQLIQEVLRDLSALDATGAPSTEDSAAVASIVAAVADDLNVRRVIYIPDANAIGSPVFADFVVLVRERVAPRFGRATDPAIVMAAEIRLAASARLSRSQTSALVKAVLERLAAIGGSALAIDGQAVAEAAPSLFADLSARRVAAIPNEASIATGQLPHVVTLLAARLIPSAVPLLLVAAAEQALRSAGRLDRSQATALTRSVLEQLEIWGAGQAAIDATSVATRIGPALASLSARDVIYIADEDSLALGSEPGPAAFDAVSRYIAARLAPAAAQGVADQAEAELRTLARIGRGTRRTLRIDRALLGRRCGVR